MNCGCVYVSHCVIENISPSSSLFLFQLWYRIVCATTIAHQKSQTRFTLCTSFRIHITSLSIQRWLLLEYIFFFVIYLLRFSAARIKCLAFHFPSVIYSNAIATIIFSFDVSHEWNWFGHSHFITIPLLLYMYRIGKRKNSHSYLFLPLQTWFIACFFSSVEQTIQMAFTKTTVAVGVRNLVALNFDRENGKLDVMKINK